MLRDPNLDLWHTLRVLFGLGGKARPETVSKARRNTDDKLRPSHGSWLREREIEAVRRPLASGW